MGEFPISDLAIASEQAGNTRLVTVIKEAAHRARLGGADHKQGEEPIVPISAGQRGHGGPGRIAVCLVASSGNGRRGAG